MWLLWSIRPRQDPIFLHYNVLFGVDFIGPWWKVLFLPLTSVIILLVNGLLGWALFSRDKFIAHILSTVSVIAAIFVFIAASLLIFINA